MSGCANAAPIFWHVTVTPNPMLAKLGPKISAGNVETIGGIMAVTAPRTNIVITRTILEV